ncbi:casein kinase I isoform gamma-2 isoform X1 [Brachionus plicatilis]|uniref:non-specific serine/threonine protein kinase n=1 Tax=Brachionus plicatilis TaxID=10195 RepID=A0A3M7R4Y6_BRAPC|nr:casein kinase I isoform gamma-2 isoform X1 [Brachionus plicatilis]
MNQDKFYKVYRNVQDLIHDKPMYSYETKSADESANNNKQFVIANFFKIGRKFGNGNFGDVRIGKNILTNEFVAINFEKIHHQTNSLQIENRIYEKLRNGEGIPRLFYYGQFVAHNVLVMELLGANLEDLFNLCNRVFILKTICMIAIQLIKRIGFVHSKNFIYRDIKPENFLIRRQSANEHRKIYMVDFGLAKDFINQEKGSHIVYNENKTLIGTARYMSVNTHLGREQNRRDDLESIGYLLIYFLKGHLPWQGLKVDSFNVRYKKIGQTKISIKLEDSNLAFTEKPDYNMLVKSFQNLMTKNFWSLDWEFDWVKKLTKPSILLNETI